MNILLLITGMIKGAFIRLSMQEWGYLFGIVFTLLRGVMIWRDNRAEQRKRTAIFRQYARKMNANAVKKVQRKLQQLDDDKSL